MSAHRKEKDYEDWVGGREYCLEREAPSLVACRFPKIAQWELEQSSVDLLLRRPSGSFQASWSLLGDALGPTLRAEKCGPVVGSTAQPPIVVGGAREGQWNTTSSLRRYERHAKVQSDELTFNTNMRQHFRDSKSLLEGVLRGNVRPRPPPQPCEESTS